MSKGRTPSDAEKVANIEGDWQKALDAHIANKKMHGVMDWLGMEATLRAFVKATNNHDLDKIVAEFTGRGYELPCPKCGQMFHTEGSCI